MVRNTSCKKTDMNEKKKKSSVNRIHFFRFNIVRKRHDDLSYGNSLIWNDVTPKGFPVDQYKKNSFPIKARAGIIYIYQQTIC